MLSQGEEIRGKWTGQVVRVERPLGTGANGQVYLVRTNKGRAAMKVCATAGDAAREWTLLERVAKVGAIFPQPMLVDDDVDDPSRYFYIMEWIPGEALEKVMPKLAEAEFHQAVLQAASGLDALHKLSHAFCDVKPQNIMVCQSPALQIRFVDVGGVTPFGRAVRQFTPYYDRAFWGFGTREADSGYDLFALALVLVCSCAGFPPSDLLSQTPIERKMWLNRALARFPHSVYRDLLRETIDGKVHTAAEFLRVAGGLPQKSTTGPSRPKPRGRHIATPAHTPKAAPRRRSAKAGVRVVGGWDWSEWLMWSSLCVAVMVTLTSWATMLGWL